MLLCEPDMSNSDDFRTPGQKLARTGPLLPGWLQDLGDAAIGTLTEYRETEYRRAFWDLLAVFGASENEEQAKERLEAILDDPKRVHELLGHLNDLTFEVHDHARPAYLRVAAESLSRKIGAELARDAGLLLRRVSGREASMLKRIILESRQGHVGDDFKNSLNAQQLTIAARVINRIVDAGLAEHLPPHPRNINKGAPQWGCRLVDEDGRRSALERYASFLKDAL